MANSLRAKLKSLNYKCVIGNDEYKEIMDKLDGHDKMIANKSVDEFVDFCLNVHRETKEPLRLRALAERFKAENV